MGAEVLALTIVILLFSVIVHEVMHGYVALKFGDRTALNAGRLTLNPLPHIDPVGTILLPALMLISGLPLFGWARPVPVNPLNFSDMRRGELLVSLAGVASNITLAVIFALLYHLVNAFSGHPLILAVLVRGVVLNFGLAIFNLLPIPPLDGSKALEAVLPYHLARSYQSFQQYGILILFAVLFFPPTKYLLSFILGTVIGLLLNLLGVTAY